MFCQYCGTELPDEAKFCPTCGKSITLTFKSDEKTFQKDECEKTNKSTYPIQWNDNINNESYPKVENLQAKNTHSNNSRKKNAGVIIALLSIFGSIVAIISIAILITIVIPSVKYNKAQDLHSKGSNYDAAVIFDQLGNYKDSKQLSADCYFEAGEYQLASDKYWYIKSDNQDNSYKYALCYFKLGKYEDAISAFRDVIDYSDANEMLVKSQVLLIASSDLNDVVSLGCYEQDGKTENGKEELQWNVVAKNNGRVLLWSDKVIEYQKFNDIKKDTNGLSSTENYISWENSFIRSWLNGEFYSSTFGELERQYIVQTEHLTTDCDKFSYKTKDNVFLFSSEEFYNLNGLTVGTMNQIETEYAKNKRKDLDECCNSCYTRNQKEYNGLFGLSEVYSPGVIDNHNTVYFFNSSSQYGAIRPCVWVDVSNID